MAAVLVRRVVVIVAAVGAIASSLVPGAVAQLSPTYYDGSCPSLQSIVRSTMTAAVQLEPRMGASILRLFFHDCFVNVRTTPSYIYYTNAAWLASLRMVAESARRPAVSMAACRDATRRCCSTTRRH
ncbi:hypothetical protein ABZP36_023132 [Zizania latifolia]